MLDGIREKRVNPIYLRLKYQVLYEKWRWLYDNYDVSLQCVIELKMGYQVDHFRESASRLSINTRMKHL